MSTKITVCLILTSLFLIIITTLLLLKKKIPVKYSILWYFFELIILLVGIVPNLFASISTKLGFIAMSNLVIGILIIILFLITLALTVMISTQKRKNTLLIQEISILKSEIKKNEK